MCSAGRVGSARCSHTPTKLDICFYCYNVLAFIAMATRCLAWGRKQARFGRRNAVLSQWWSANIIVKVEGTSSKADIKYGEIWCRSEFGEVSIHSKKEKRGLSSPLVSSSLTLSTLPQRLYLLVYDCLVQNLKISRQNKVNRKISRFDIWRERWCLGYAVLRPARVQTEVQTTRNIHSFQIIRKIVAMWMRLGCQSPAA